MDSELAVPLTDSMTPEERADAKRVNREAAIHKFLEVGAFPKMLKMWLRNAVLAELHTHVGQTCELGLIPLRNAFAILQDR